jgi:hypothetical protein
MGVTRAMEKKATATAAISKVSVTTETGTKIKKTTMTTAAIENTTASSRERQKLQEQWDNGRKYLQQPWRQTEQQPEEK